MGPLEWAFLLAHKRREHIFFHEFTVRHIPDPRHPLYRHPE